MSPRIKEQTPEEIAAKMRERQPLPIGKTQFMEWSERIIAGAMVQADHRSQRFVLSDMILHLGPQEDHKEDAYFIHTLRKYAVNQTAIMVRDELKAEQQAEAEAKDKADGKAVGSS